MKQQGLEPNVITYTAGISADELTLQLFNRCGTRPPAIWAQCELPQWVLQPVNPAQQQGLQPNDTYAAVLGAGGQDFELFD